MMTDCYRHLVYEGDYYYLLQAKNLSADTEDQLTELLESVSTSGTIPDDFSDEDRDNKPLTVNQYRQLRLGFTHTLSTLSDRQHATIRWLSARFPTTIFVLSETTPCSFSVSVFSDGKNITDENNPIFMAVMLEMFATD